MTTDNPTLQGLQPINATLIPGSKIMIVGDCPTVDDMLRRSAFTGTLGKALDGFLHDAGIARTECSISTVVKVAPLYGKIENLYTDKKQHKPNAACYKGQTELIAEVNRVKPNVIIALGNLALWALTGKIGANKWRGSVLPAKPEFGDVKVVPTFDPRIVMKMWEWRPIFMRDLQRAKDESATNILSRPAWNFRLRPSFECVRETLAMLRRNAELEVTPLSIDIETRGAMTACIGIAWSRTEAICIPLMAVGAVGHNYWSEAEELFILEELRMLFTHPNVRVIGQNFGYDAQYFAVQAGFLPVVHYDTMLMQHTVLAGMKKSLDFISSMYCDFYQYWKDDGKEWDPKVPEEDYWTYNCTDCCYTFECAEVLDDLIERNRLREQYNFLRDMWPHVVRTMLRGVRVDERAKASVANDLMNFIAETSAEIYAILGHQINLGSPKQLMQLFYGDLKMAIVKNKKTKQPTTDDDALNLFKKREPLLTGLVDRIAMVRSASVLLKTFALMPLDIDKRMRCYYNLAGTETYRLNSGENAFGSGGNLQNIPKGDEDKAAAKKLELINAGKRQLIVPNIRKLFVPDSGMTFFDVDLDRADLMVVIWEADDDDLRAAVCEGIDLHTYNASVLFGVPETAVTYALRQAAKQFAHGTNYGGSARTMAITCGLTVHASEVAQRRWFAAHPGIKEWHRRTEAQLQALREVRNVFGFRRRYFDRIESVLPEALAWQPQSVVALVINRGWKNLAEKMPEVQVLLQVHDSLAGQFPTHRAKPIMRDMKRHLEIEIPYSRPLTIGVGISTSTKSWGDVEETEWPAPLLTGNQPARNIIIPA
jgi:uracil-DNA glycosylase family 4